ncbi:hypothetical protein Pcac1_g19271 [Phytophthora cactorum]|nr:hypothetical protein Pcac1_g19271 [Phytophthora cactorum]
MYSAAIAAAKFADQRLDARTRTDFTGSLRRFAAFCCAEGYPDPLKQRFIQLPGVIAAYINQLATSNKSQWPTEKLHAAISWHYTKPEMLAGGHPHDRCKAKKRERTPKRASPMSLAMMTRIITFLETDSSFNQTMREWFSAVCSLAFYGMCRINEVLLMKKGDIQLGLQRRSRKNGATIKFGCFTIRDRKTDHDPLASRTYSLHHLTKDEQAAEALTFLVVAANDKRSPLLAQPEAGLLLTLESSGARQCWTATSHRFSTLSPMLPGSARTFFVTTFGLHRIAFVEAERSTGSCLLLRKAGGL